MANEDESVSDELQALSLNKVIIANLISVLSIDSAFSILGHATS